MPQSKSCRSILPRKKSLRGRRNFNCPHTNEPKFWIDHIWLLGHLGVKHTKVIRTCEQSIYSYHKLTHGKFPFSILHSPRATIGVSNFLHGEAILLAPHFPHPPFSILRRSVSTHVVNATRDRLKSMKNKANDTHIA